MAVASFLATFSALKIGGDPWNYGGLVGLTICLMWVVVVLKERDSLLPATCSNLFKALLFLSPFALLALVARFGAKPDVLAGLQASAGAYQDKVEKVTWLTVAALLLLSFAKDLKVDEVFGSVFDKGAGSGGPAGKGGGSLLPLLAAAVTATAAVYVVRVPTDQELLANLNLIQQRFQDLSVDIHGYSEQQSHVRISLDQIEKEVRESGGKDSDHIIASIRGLHHDINIYFAGETTTAGELRKLSKDVGRLETKVEQNTRDLKHKFTTGLGK